MRDGYSLNATALLKEEEKDMRLVILTAACGVGKSTIKDELKENGALKDFACIDTDEVGINWWDYGMEDKTGFNNDCIRKAIRQANGKNLLFSTCLNPIDFYSEVTIPPEITSTLFIAMTCSDEEITKRLKARPAERMCGDDEFIKGQIEYLNWYRKNKGKFQLYVDNTDLTICETAKKIADFVMGQPE